MKLKPEIFDTLITQSVVFHYTSAKVALENILPYARLRLTPLSLTNDPREYKELFLSSGGWGDYSDTEGKIRKAMEKVDEIRRNKYQMVSFSLNKTNDSNKNIQSILEQYKFLGCCKPRMWSQYGESHHGIVLAFDSEKILKGFDNQLKEGTRIYAKHIIYESFNIKLNLVLNSNKILETDIEDYCEGFIEKNIDPFFFMKSPDYQDENEYRIIVKAITQDRVFINIKDSLLAVIIGDRFPDGLLPSLKYLCKKLNIDCKRIYWESDQPILIDCLPNDYQLFKDWIDL
jgi:hypothetical protein